MKVWPALGIVLIQVILCLAHWFLFVTWSGFWPLNSVAQHWLGAALAVLSFSFIATAIPGFRISNALIRVSYTAASIWIGALNLFVWAACLCWLAAIPIHAFAGPSEPSVRGWVADALFGLAIVTCLYAWINARRIRERRYTIALPNLPVAWHGRRAVLITDMHLGHINGAQSARRVAQIVRRFDPAVLFLAGDMYDGAKVDAARLVAPVATLKLPLGIYFCGGNHEEIGDESNYLAALREGGIRVLENELMDVDGIQVAGVRYADTTFPMRLRTLFEKMHVDRNRASILLNHVPNRLPLVEQAGFNLQLSGHTHGGQMFPITWITRRAFGKFTSGLNRFGALQVFTSTGAGTWGPPMRLGTAPEVILITFEQAG